MKKSNIFKILLACSLAMTINSSFAQEIPEEIKPSKQEKNIVSLIEKSFNGPVGITSSLNQIGYDFFQNFQIQGSGKYDKDYKLSIGEKLNLYFWGDSINVMTLSGKPVISPLLQTQVDSKGEIFIPGVGVVKAENKSISEVEKDIQSLASKSFKSVKVKLTISDSSEFAVFIYGYVNKPGKININSNSTFIEALAAAGGVNKNGSLRNITFTSKGKVSKVDLYNVIFKGEPSNITIRPNDIIFVNNIGDVVAIRNGVKIPGIYELTQGETLNEAIGYAGGVLPSTNLKTININSYNKTKGQRVSKDIDSEMFDKQLLSNGDILEFSSLYNKSDNFVRLNGNVKHPGVFEYKKGMKLSDVLPDKNELQDETLLYQAVIKRISPVDKQLKTIPVSLEDYLAGGNNPYLEPKDIITVYKSTSASFVEVYGCINKPKSIPFQKKLTLKNIITDVQFIASFQENKDNQNLVNLKIDDKEKKDNDITLPLLTSNNNLVIPAEKVAVEITNPKAPGKLQTYYLLDILIKNDATNGIKINPGDKIMFRTLRDNEVLKTVKISGYVHNPGVYSFIKGQKLTDLIEQAGGLREDANLRGISLKREALAFNLKKISARKDKKDIDLIQGKMMRDSNLSTAEAKSQEFLIESIKESEKIEHHLVDDLNGRIVLNIKENDLSKLSKETNITLQDGDEIFIPKVPTYVSVIGEVYNESSFIYNPKKKASYYIDLVGGYTPNANKKKIYKISTNGKAYKLKNLSAKIEPGDTIIVPRKLKGSDWLNTVMKSMQIIASTLASVFILTEI